MGAYGENQWHHLFSSKPLGSSQFSFKLRHIGAPCEEKRASSILIHIAVAVTSVISNMCPCRMPMGVEGTVILLLCCFPEGRAGNRLLPKHERACLWGGKHTYALVWKSENQILFFWYVPGNKYYSFYFINDGVIASGFPTCPYRALESELRNAQSLVSGAHVGASCQLDPLSPSFISFFHIPFLCNPCMWQLLYEFALTT